MRSLFFSLLVLSASSVGCSYGYTRVYDGLPLPQEEVVRIKSDHCDSVGFVDDKPLSGNSEGYQFFGSEGVEVLPGRHTIRAEFWWSYNFHNCSESTDTDYSAHTQCEIQRSNEIATQGKSSLECNLCNFEKKMKTCEYTVQTRVCKKEVDLTAGSTHTARCATKPDFALYFDEQLLTNCKEPPPKDSSGSTNCGNGCYSVCPASW